MGGPCFRRRLSLNCWINSAAGWVVIVNCLLTLSPATILLSASRLGDLQASD